jgi:hypothetical protein
MFTCSKFEQDSFCNSSRRFESQARIITIRWGQRKGILTKIVKSSELQTPHAASEIFLRLEPQPEYLFVRWRKKPEVTSGQFRILPVFQLLLTRTNWNKPELCSYGSVKVLSGVRWVVGVAKYCS